MPVFHTDKATQLLVRKYCGEHGFIMKQWIVSAIKHGIKDKIGLHGESLTIILSKKDVPKIEPKKSNKKKLEELNACKGDDLWTRPPFWTK